MDKSFPKWAAFRFWNKASIVFMLGTLGCFILGVVLSLAGGRSEILLFVISTLFIPSVLGVGVSSLGLAFLRCPRCAKLFTSQWNSFHKTKHKCVHCGLGLYEEFEAD